MSEHFRLRDLFPNAIFSKINTADFFVGSCHDTRHLLNKEIFVCLKGTNNHGIDYAQEAIHKGAIGILIDYEHEYLFDGPKIIVEDVQSALRHAVQKIRQNYHHKIIAVTGSAGKTSTKEYYRQICPDKNACISYGNWNNLLGLMINLSRLSNFSPYNFFELYRGQGCDCWKLIPKIARNIKEPNKIRFLEENITKDFFQLLKERGLIDSISVGKKGNDFELEWLLLQQAQHYELPTRFIDWSGKWETALCFAVADVS